MSRATQTDPAPILHRADNNVAITLLQIVVFCFIALRIWFDLKVDPMGDEAYYWMWGQNLALSYFDHPPLHAWLLRLVEILFGWNGLSTRILTWFTLGGTLTIFWLWGKRFLPENPALYFWQTSAIYLAMPVIFLMTTISFNDHLLLFFCFAATYFFLQFTDQWEQGGRDSRDLYFGAAMLGFAVLSKYNGVFVGLGFGLFVVMRPKLWPLLKSPHLYLAALLAITMQVPVFYWNLTEGFASYKFHLSERLMGSWGYMRPGNMLDVLGTMAGVISPFLFLALFTLPFRRMRSPFEARARALTLTIFSVALGLLLIISLYVYPYFYWNIVAYGALTALAFRYLGGRWLLVPHLLYGLFGAALLTYNFAVQPASILHFSDPGTPANYGWQEVAEAVAAERQRHPEAFLAATRYTYAAQLGFQLHDKSVTAFNPIHSQYDFWFDAKAHQGQDALLLADKAYPIDYAKTLFQSMTPLRSIPIARGGKQLWVFELYLAQRFTGPTP